MNEFERLVSQHLALQAQVAKDPRDIKLAEVESLLADSRAAGREVAGVEQREHLRAILRYWGAFVYEQTGEYPATQLTPFAGGEVDGAAALPSVPLPPSGTQSTSKESLAAPPAPRSQPGWLSNPLVWLLLLALAAVALIILVVSFFIPISSSQSPPTAEISTGIPPDIQGPEGENGAIPVTRPPTATDGGADFILSVRPQATLQELANTLQTNVETLQALNPALSSPPWSGMILALIGQPAEDAQLVVTGRNVAVYDRPSWRAQIIATAENGVIVPVIGRTADYNWYWISTGEGTGWLAESDVGLIYPTVPDSLPVVARIQLVPDDDIEENDNDS